MVKVHSLAAFGLVASLAVAATAAGPPTALATGQPAPPLELPAADGTTRSLAGLAKPVVLVFYRGLW